MEAGGGGQDESRQRNAALYGECTFHQDLLDMSIHSSPITCDIFLFLLIHDTGSSFALENEKLNKLHQELNSLSRKLEEMKQGLDSVWLFRD